MKIAGTAFVRVDGHTYTLGGSCTVSPSGVEREGQAGLSGVAGFLDRPRVPFVEVEFRTTSDLSLTDLEAVEDATVKVELNNGTHYVLRHAWAVPPFDLDAAAGTVTVRFEGMECKELRA